MLNKFFTSLPAFIVTVVKLFLLQFVLLELCRLGFYFAFKTIDGAEMDVLIILKAFRMGLEFDMVASTYALFLPTFLLLVNEFLYKKTRILHKAAFVITLLIFWLYAFISAADFPYYKQFGSHLNKQAFLWAASPGFVLKLIFGNISYYGYMFLFFVFAFVIYKLVKRFYAEHLLRLQNRNDGSLKTSLFALLLIPFLIAGARGRLSGKSTTHEGLAIVSDNLFVNQIALNPNFTLFRSLFFQKVRDYSVPSDIDVSIAYARNYLGVKGPY